MDWNNVQVNDVSRDMVQNVLSDLLKNLNDIWTISMTYLQLQNKCLQVCVTEGLNRAISISCRVLLMENSVHERKPRYISMEAEKLTLLCEVS